MSNLRDSQRSAVYCWEDKIRKRWPANDLKLTLKQCASLIIKVWDDYRPGQETPKLKDGRGRRRPCGSRWEIKLPRWSRCQIVVLHEIAHSLQQQQPWHGPEFARLFLELLVHYAGIPAREAKTMAMYQKPRRVRFAQAADVPKCPSATWKRWKVEDQKLAKLLQQHRSSEPDKITGNPKR